eukprot:15348101-Ditylum_brightwellii.AAC.1
MKKENFKSKQEAAKYISYRTRVRKRSGYCFAADPSRTKQTRVGKVIIKNKHIHKKSNTDRLPLRCEFVPKPTGRYLCEEKKVNPAVSEKDSSLASFARVHDNLHARLALVNRAKTNDGFYILQ